MASAADPDRPYPLVICPRCDAVTRGDRDCWLCHGPTQAGKPAPPDANPYAARPVDGSMTPDGRPNFSGGRGEGFWSDTTAHSNVAPNHFTWVLIAGVAIVIVGLAVVAPGLAILFGVLTTPALIRTALYVLRRRKHGIELSVVDKSLLFVTSVAALITALVTYVATFFVACFAVCFRMAGSNQMGSGGQRLGDWLSTIAWGIPLIAGVAVLAILWWPRKIRSPTTK